MRAQGIDGARIHQRLLEMAYIEGDEAAAARELQWFAGRREEYLSLGLQAASLNVAGRRLRSSHLYRRAADAALHAGLESAAGRFEEAAAQADALSGNCHTVHILGRPGLALALCGETARAQKLLDDGSKLFPHGTLWHAVHVPVVQATLELQRQPAKAVELLASAEPYERVYPEVSYSRGLAYLRLHKGTEAVAEFRKVVDHKGASWGSTWLYPNWGLYYPASYLGLARGFALAGDTSSARAAYQKLLTLWQGADSDFVLLNQAKVEYAKLR